jgi:ubiquinone/menaquinone biosynthesis C-methylase UbiE
MWTERLIKKYDPDFKHRWEVYNEAVLSLLNKNTVWIDCGCGNNEKVFEFGHLSKKAYGLDIFYPSENKANFIKADIKYLPIKTGAIDLITLRFVVEHFKNPEEYFTEYSRVLKNKGKVLLITTNKISPFIFLPKILLPQKSKTYIITKVFKVKSDDVFKTYHNINSCWSLKKLKKFKLLWISYLSDLNQTRSWMFALLFSWHLLTKFKFLTKIRTNIIAILEKIDL